MKTTCFVQAQEALTNTAQDPERLTRELLREVVVVLSSGESSLAELGQEEEEE